MSNDSKEVDEATARLFHNQVGGHVPFLVLDGKVYKPVKEEDENEFLFYKRLREDYPALVNIVPSYYGEKYILITGEGAVLLEADVPVEEVVDKDMPLPFTHEVPKSSDMLRGKLQLNDWSKVCQVRPKNQWMNQGAVRCVVLQDLTTGFRRPCILDLKLGLYTHSQKDDPEKRARKKAKAMASTSAALGVRLGGMQLNDVNDEQYELVTKKAGLKLTEAEFYACLTQFLSPVSQNNILNRELVTSILARIVEIRELLTQEPQCCLFSSSLLLVYEGATSSQGPSSRVDAKALGAQVHVVDFGTSVHATKGNLEQNIADACRAGVFKGLATVINYLQEQERALTVTK